MIQRNNASLDEDYKCLCKKHVFNLLEGFILILLRFNSLVLLISSYNLGNRDDLWVLQSLDLILIRVNN